MAVEHRARFNAVRVLHVDRHLRDYLTANEKWRRTLRLTVRTDALLRQGGGRVQARKQARYLEDARSQIREQMRKQRRRAFRGELSVRLTIFASGVAGPPSAPKSVKRYLDAMTGLAYGDDRQIAHLEVHRFADDSPYQRRRAAESGEFAPFDSLVDGTPDHPWVSIAVTPLRIYTADYDRAFRVRDQRQADWERDSDELRFWEYEDDSMGEDHLDELLSEREDDAENRGLYALYNDEQRRTARRVRETLIAGVLSKQILGRRPSPWDRPGPNPFAFLGELAPHPQLVQGWRVSLPGEFWLPGPEEPSWKEGVHERMTAHRAQWAVVPPAFDEPLSLDIAAHGSAGAHRDVDNLAHPILAAFEALYCADRRGTVTGYRAYRLEANRSGVRVQVMPGKRLTQLADAIRSARSYVLARGPRDARW